MKRIPLLILLVLLCSYSQALALELNEQECINRALMNNSGLKSFEEDLAAAREDVKISRTGFFPALKAKGSFYVIDRPERLIINRDTFGTGIPPQDVDVSTGENTFYSLNMVMTQPLFTGGNLTHTYQKSMVLTDEARQRFERQKKELTLEVEKAFREALNAQLYTEILEKVASAKKERLRVLLEREAEGYVEKEDVLEQETDIAYTELELYKGKNREEIARSRLRNLIRYEGRDGPILKGSSFNGTLVASLVEIQDAAVANREELKASHLRIAAAEEDIAIAKSAYYPQASLEGKFTQQSDTNITRPQVWMLTAQLEWSLFDWGKTTSEVRKKAAQRQRAQYEREELENAVLLETEQGWLSVKEMEKSVTAHKKRVATDEYRLTVTAEKYAEGKVKLADVIEREAEFTKSYNEYLVAINDLDADLARLEASTSVSLVQWLRAEEIYKPDLDSLEKKMKKLPPKKLEGTSEYIPVAPNQNDTDAGPMSLAVKSVSHPVVKHFSVAAEARELSPPASIVVQMASFKSRKPAYKYMKGISRKIRGRKFAVITLGKFYKVRIKGFRNADEAADVMKSADIKDYLVLRENHGQ
jgi:outer membrane protein TolC